MANYGRAYASKEQVSHRYSMFRENYIQVKNHNEGDNPFQMGINQFSDMNEEEFVDTVIGKGLIVPKGRSEKIRPFTMEEVHQME